MKEVVGFCDKWFLISFDRFIGKEMIKVLNEWIGWFILVFGL